MPVTLGKTGKTSNPTLIKPSVHKKDMIADIFPFDKAINIAEPKILNPQNKKLNENIENPYFVIS